LWRFRALFYTHPYSQVKSCLFHCSMFVHCWTFVFLGGNLGSHYSHSYILAITKFEDPIHHTWAVLVYKLSAGILPPFHLSSAKSLQITPIGEACGIFPPGPSFREWLVGFCFALSFHEKWLDDIYQLKRSFQFAVFRSGSESQAIVHVQRPSSSVNCPSINNQPASYLFKSIFRIIVLSHSLHGQTIWCHHTTAMFNLWASWTF